MFSLNEYATKWNRPVDNNFAVACYDGCSIVELQEATESPADPVDMTTWGIEDVAEWQDAVAAALCEKRTNTRPHLLTPVQFDASLVRDTAVEARWTHNHCRYVAPATVIKVNTKSVLVKLDAPVYSTTAQARYITNDLTAEDFREVYPANNVITLPRYASAGYSANNGAYPVADEAEVAMLPLTPVIEAVSEAQHEEEYLGEADDLRDFPRFSLTDTDPEWQTDLGAAASSDPAQARNEAEEQQTLPPAHVSIPEMIDRIEATIYTDVLQEDTVPLVLDLADAQGTLGEEDELLVAEPRVWLYTTAPGDLDLAGTVTVEDVGMLHPHPAMARLGSDALPYRKVQLPAGQERVQAAAYGSGSWNTHTPAEWAELLGQAWFCNRFVPRGCESLPEAPAHAPLNFSNPLGYQSYASQPLVIDHAPAPNFNRDDAAWLDALDVMLVPEPVSAAIEAGHIRWAMLCRER